MVTVAERIRRVRELAGLSRSALSQFAGLAKGHVGLIEGNDKADPQGSTLGALSEATGVSVDWFVRGVGDEPDGESVRAAIKRRSKEKRAKA